MKNVLEIVIHGDWVNISYPAADIETEFVSGKESSLGDHLVLFCQKNGINPTSVVFFISEELLFFKSFKLPIKTTDLKTAINFQISQLTPFDADTMIYSFTTKAEGNDYLVCLYAVQSPVIQGYLQQVAVAGYSIMGLFPESQRFVTVKDKKNKWVLVIPGRLSKVLIFSGNRLDDRKLMNMVPSFAELAEIHGTKNIYHVEPPRGSSFLAAAKLKAQKPVFKDFNMLPAEFRRPDVLKFIIAALVIVNIIGILGMAAFKEIHLQSEIRKQEDEIAQIMPKVREVTGLREEEKNLLASLEGFENFENIDLINLLVQLTKELPPESYLEQLRMERGQTEIRLLGYTENIGDLTTKMQSVGDTKLKSTTRRRNRTYFHMETNVP